MLTPKELDKVIIHSMAHVALDRKSRGIKLNYPEAVAVISHFLLEAAREGKTVEEVQKSGQTILTRNDVMEGVPEMIDILYVEAVFPDGTKLITVQNPIQ